MTTNQITLELPPKPIIPAVQSSDPKFSVLDWDPLEIARQLTLVEFTIYKTIQANELLDLHWTKKDKAEKAPNILNMIHTSNRICRWVETEILCEKIVQKRATILGHFIRVAQACYKLNNYNAVMEMLSALGSSSIYRMKKTWALLPKKLTTTFDELKSLMSPDKSFKQYRSSLKQSNPPAIPYLGLFLQDLTFIEEGNADLIGTEVNFTKRQKIGTVIVLIRLYQQKSYALEAVPDMVQYLLGAEHLEDSELFKQSLILEPRE